MLSQQQRHTHSNHSGPEEDSCHEQFGDDDTSVDEACVHGAADDEAADEYALLYDGDDRGAKLRRY